MTIDFTNDDQLGPLLRAEVPEPAREYWTEIKTGLVAAAQESQSERESERASEPIDIGQVDGDQIVVPFRERIGRSFVGLTAIAIAAAMLVIVGLIAGTRWQRSNSDVNTGFADSRGQLITDQARLDALPGPEQNRDHWHAVYGVWDCTAGDGGGDWIPAFQSNQDDTGIHSHGDGMIYIHPFFEASAGVNATFSHFISEMQLQLTDSTLVLDDGRTLIEGTECDGQESVLHLRRWQFDFIARSETELAPRIIVQDLNDERFYNDREVWILALAPLDAEIPLPPPERFAALDTWTLTGTETLSTIAASTTRSLDADVTRPLGLPFEDVMLLESNELVSAFNELTRDPRPDWTDSIIDGSFEPLASAVHDPNPRLELASYVIQVDDGTTRPCTGIIDVDAQQLWGAAICDPLTGAPELIFDERPSGVFILNTPADATYVVIETNGGTRIATNTIEQHAFVGWDFGADPIVEVWFHSAALRETANCRVINPEQPPQCVEAPGS